MRVVRSSLVFMLSGQFLNCTPWTPESLHFQTPLELLQNRPAVSDPPICKVCPSENLLQLLHESPDAAVVEASFVTGAADVAAPVNGASVVTSLVAGGACFLLSSDAQG